MEFITVRTARRLIATSVDPPLSTPQPGEFASTRRAHHPRLQMDFKVPAVDTALATSAAPVFFPPHRSRQEVTLIDGGIWANNPVGLAVTEAISMLGMNGTDLDVLSVGCTSVPPDFTQRGWGWRILGAESDRRGHAGPIFRRPGNSPTPSRPSNYLESTRLQRRGASLLTG